MPNSKLDQKIEHVVVVMLENRGFDSVLGYLYTEDDPPKNHIPDLQTGALPFEGLDFVDTTKLTNTCVHGGRRISQDPVPAVSASNSPGWDPGEEFEHVNAQLYDVDPTNTTPTTPVNMKGFLRDYSIKFGGDGEALRELMHMYTPADLPVLNGLAKSYAVCDEWFASVPTQTNANRAFSLCGTSNGLVDNGLFTTSKVTQALADDRFDVDTIWNVLDKNGNKDWGVYYEIGYPLFAQDKSYTQKVFKRVNQIPGVANHFHKMKDFYDQASKGKLPQFSYIEPSWGGFIRADTSAMGNEYHPPSDVTPGEQLLKDIYRALSKSSKWSKTLLVIVFDEHGGTYDHVPPPATATPPWGSDPNPKLPEGRQYNFNFDRFGVRVPAIFVSPLIAEGTVLRSAGVPYDHTSLIATILEFMIPNVPRTSWGLGERVKAAPTFDYVLTLDTPRKDFALNPRPAKSNTIQYGDTISLQHFKSGNFISPAESGVRAYFATLGQGKVQDLEFRLGYGDVQDDSVVQIRTSEYLTPILTHISPIVFPGIRNFLGKWKDIVLKGKTLKKLDCFYYSTIDSKLHDEQLWKISRVGNAKGPLKSGDVVTILNVAHNETLCSNGNFLTTKTGSPEEWRVRHKVTGKTIWVTTTQTKDNKGKSVTVYRYSASPKVPKGFTEARDSGIRVFPEPFPGVNGLMAQTKKYKGIQVYRYVTGSSSGLGLPRPKNPWVEDKSIGRFSIWIHDNHIDISAPVYRFDKMLKEDVVINKLSLSPTPSATDIKEGYENKIGGPLFYMPNF